jgi:hypothetical protein
MKLENVIHMFFNDTDIDEMQNNILFELLAIIQMASNFLAKLLNAF